MKKPFEKRRNILWKIVLLPAVLFGMVLIYGIMTFLGGVIPVNPGRAVPVTGKSIYLLNNGYHVAIALPRDSSPYKDIFDRSLKLSGSGGFYYFGWGDRQFYLGTPTVRDIDWSMALKALFTPTPSVLEVLFLSKISSDQPGIISVLVTEEELSGLYQYVKDSLIDSEGKVKQIPSDEIDQVFQGSIFFEAQGSYSLFNTCNNWTSRGLKRAGLSTHLWTPFTWGVAY